MDCMELPLKGMLASASTVKDASNNIFGFSLVPGYAMQMRPNKAETTVHGCHCSGDVAVRTRTVLAVPYKIKLANIFNRQIGAHTSVIFLL